MNEHPEEFWDKIREYSNEGRYKPTSLETLLLDQAGYRCSICKQPYSEIHHMHHLKDGGKTEYENLIVLCPNCHTGVHQTGIPNEDQLRQIKKKQEIAYELPIRSRISEGEKDFLKRMIALSDEQQVVYSESSNEDIEASSDDDAVQLYRLKLGMLYLQEVGIIVSNTGIVVKLARELEMYSVVLEIRLTPKGIKWIRYIKETNWLEVP